jgi:PhzF family phenazine biosynthesis protein
MKVKFKQVDVFSERSCQGNPVCVFLESKGLNTKDMQKIARWTNLSETTFLSPSKKGDYAVRIFTPSEELPFAGHPTLGSAWAFLEDQQSTKSELVQDCDFGLVQIQKKDKRIFFTLPHYEILKHLDERSIEEALGIKVDKDAMTINTGPHWLIANVSNLGDLDMLYLEKSKMLDLLKSLDSTGITLYEVRNDGVHVRTFFECYGDLIEDPVCGSGNAAVAVHLKETGRISKIGNSYHVYQGKHVGRDGHLDIEIGESIKVGGSCNTVFTGEATF